MPAGVIDNSIPSGTFLFSFFPFRQPLEQCASAPRQAYSITSMRWTISNFSQAIRSVFRTATMADPLVVIYGSTGTGKSDLAVELATRFNGEIINADAMQMYRGLPIITNQLTPEEQRGIPHYLLGNIGLDEEPWSVTSWKREATRIISDIRSRGKLPIVVGGTSYYLDGLLFDEKLVESDPATTEESEAAAKITREELASQHPILRESAEVMLAKLQEVDPVMAERWHPKDIRKIRNSLEIYLTTGRRASDIYAEQRARKEAKRADQPPSPWNLLLFWLYAKPDVLNERLDKRVDKMVANGLLDETSSVYDYLQRRLAAGDTVDRTKGIWQSIGFRQFESYLSAVKSTETDTPQAALEKLKQQGIEDTKTATRQYAKYQIRWIARKTIAALQEENLLSKFYLLDSSNISQSHSEVAEKGCSLLAKHLADQPLPRPEELSDTAREVLAEQLERSNRPETICNKTCEVCEKEFRIEEQWQKHLKSKKHQKAVKWAKRQAEGWPTRGEAKGDKVEGTDDDADADADADGQVPKP